MLIKPLPTRNNKNISVSTLKLNQSRRRRKRRRCRNVELNVGTEGNYQFIDNNNSTITTTGRSLINEERKSDTLKAVEKSGLVNTKISVYEKNLSNVQDEDPSKKKKKVLGVPLVGMQSGAANFPMVNTQGWNKVASVVEQSKLTIKEKKRAPSIPKYSEDATVNYPNKFAKNTCSTTRSTQTKPTRSLRRNRITSATVNLHKGSRGKRKTLYAKDAEGDEAIRVLSNLCLNPMARSNKKSTFMIW